MPFHSCAIRLEDGSLVAEGVEVALEGPEHGGTGQWYGTISAAAAEVTSLVAGKRYQLCLDDGRTGFCVVRRNTSAGPVDRAVAIQGAGPLK
jgi:hypothetical protein